jgi:putative peptidoglycan lipid II flippase
MFFNVLKKFAYKWSFSIGEGQLQGVLYASLPLFAAGILFRSTTVFERFFAARLPQGSLSYLGSGNQIIVILSTIVSSGIATTSFPLFSKYWAVNDLESLKKTFSRVISFVLLIIFPMIIIFAISGIDIIRVVFERGAFMAKDTEALYNTLLGLMGFFLFSSIGNVLIRILYLSNHTIAVAVIATIELVVYLICAMILTRLFQYVGLALSMSIGACCNVIISFIFIRKKVVNLDMYTLLRRLGSIFISSVFILLFFFLANKYFLQHVNLVVRVIIISIMVIAAYVLLMSRMLKNIGYRQLIHL